MSKIEIIQADITTLEVDCIVNAANEHLQEGGGVCGAIFARAGARKLQKACDNYGFCATGDAVMTPGFDLSAANVVHAVGPIWTGGQNGEPEQLYSCYQEAMLLAMENGCRSIAFPLISSGIFGYPKHEAWKIALSSVRTFQQENSDYELDVIFAVLSPEMKAEGEAVLAEVTENFSGKFGETDGDMADVIASDGADNEITNKSAGKFDGTDGDMADKSAGKFGETDSKITDVIADGGTDENADDIDGCVCNGCDGAICDKKNTDINGCDVSKSRTDAGSSLITDFVKVVRFNGPDDVNGFLSSGHICSFEVDGQSYCSVDQYVQRQKALLFGDDDAAENIMSAADQDEILAIGRNISGFDSSIWQENRQNFMKKAILAKFDQNLDLYGRLVATGKSLPVMCSVSDTVNGIGLDLDDPRAANKSKWRGENQLGFAIREVRTILNNKAAGKLCN